MAANQEIAEFLRQYRVLLELSGADAFRVRAYANAARILEGLDTCIEERVQRRTLTEIRGVGRSVAALVDEFVRSGRARAFDQLKASIPAGLLEMLKVRGLGVKKVRTLREEFGIDSLEALEAACRAHRLSPLSGFGKKTQENILRSIEYLRRHQGQFHLHIAAEAAEALHRTLAAHPCTRRLSIAGSLRRGRELIEKIDLVLSSEKAAAVSQAFVAHPQVAALTAREEGRTTVRLQSGIQAQLRIVGEAEFSCCLHHSTGSEEHNAQLRTRARRLGFQLEECGLFRGGECLECGDEAALFAALDLEYIPPELREGRGEIEAAGAGTLPGLVGTADLRGMLHVHSTYSDGRNPLALMAEAVRARGYEYLGICDHSRSAVYAGGLDVDEVRRQHDEIDTLNQGCGDFRIFKGIESDILAGGELDYEDKILESFDFVIISVHSHFRMDEREMTRRILRAIEHPSSTLLGHPTGRLLLEREGYAVDLDALIEACAEHRVAIEVNANPHRLDLDWRQVKKARDAGVKIALDTDAHQIAHLDYIDLGVRLARKGWLRPEDVLNTLDTVAIAAHFDSG